MAKGGGGGGRGGRAGGGGGGDAGALTREFSSGTITVDGQKVKAQIMGDYAVIQKDIYDRNGKYLEYQYQVIHTPSGYRVFANKVSYEATLAGARHFAAYYPKLNWGNAAQFSNATKLELTDAIKSFSWSSGAGYTRSGVRR